MKIKCTRLMVFMICLVTSLSLAHGQTSKPLEKTLRGTWAWDIVSNTDGTRTNTDVWWEHVNDKVRYLVPLNGAQLGIVIGKTFDQLTEKDVAAVNLDKKRLSASDEKPEINVGTVLAVRTRNGRFAKLEITGFTPLSNLKHSITKYNMRLRCVVFEK